MQSTPSSGSGKPCQGSKGPTKVELEREVEETAAANAAMRQQIAKLETAMAMTTPLKASSSALTDHAPPSRDESPMRRKQKPTVVQALALARQQGGQVAGIGRAIPTMQQVEALFNTLSGYRPGGTLGARSSAEVRRLLTLQL
jgi:hypothetical protein